MKESALIASSNLDREHPPVTTRPESNVESFDCLVELYHSRIYGLALRMTGCSEDAFDLTQEAFLRAFTALPLFRGTCSFSTWLYQIARNVCLDEIKRMRRHRAHGVLPAGMSVNDEGLSLIDQIADPSPGPEELLLQNERQRLMQQAMTMVPEHLRQAFVLYEMEGETYEEISQLLDIELGTVKSRLHRARHLLRSLLELALYQQPEGPDADNGTDPRPSACKGSIQDDREFTPMPALAERSNDLENGLLPEGVQTPPRLL